MFIAKAGNPLTFDSLIKGTTKELKKEHVLTLDYLLSNNDDNTVNVCHKSGNSWKFKTISENSLNGHLAHGDFLYKGRPDVYDWEMDDWCNINAPQ
jgi:hypothetical protein